MQEDTLLVCRKEGEGCRRQGKAKIRTTLLTYYYLDVGNDFIQHILYTVPYVSCNANGPIVATSNLYQPCHRHGDGSGGITVICFKSLCT